jgi:tripeptidyl-peptidase-2
MEVQEAENLYKEVVAANQNFLTPHLSLITSYETTGSDLKCQLPFAFKNNLKSGDQDELKSKLSRILELTDLVIQGINIENLLAFYGLKSDNRPDASKIKVNMDKQKQQLLEAYTKKVIVLGKLSILGQDEGAVEEVEKAVAEVTKFVDLNDLKVSFLSNRL